MVNGNARDSVQPALPMNWTKSNGNFPHANFFFSAFFQIECGAVQSHVISIQFKHRIMVEVAAPRTSSYWIYNQFSLKFSARCRFQSSRNRPMEILY